LAGTDHLVGARPHLVAIFRGQAAVKGGHEEYPPRKRLRFGPDNPIIYDNDWWFDLFDNNYLWAQASLGEVNLRGNIVSRDMWEWQKGYLYPMEKCVKDAQKALKLARDAGLKNIPELTLGSERVLERPGSGKIEDTKSRPTPGSRLIVVEAKKASAKKPLLVIAGGPMTTVANALLTNP
jgi:hypothetical protein